jgi:hypothetical protein
MLSIAHLSPESKHYEDIIIYYIYIHEHQN